MNALLAELKRRKVLRVAGGYVVTSWLILQVSEVLIPALGLPDSTLSLVLLVLVLGFPVALVIAWMVELTPLGIRLEREADQPPSENGLAWIVGAVALAAGVVGYQLRASADEETGAAALAVLPFVNMSSDVGNEPFSDGLTEELLNALAAETGLRVVARSSSFVYKGRNVDLREVGRDLAAMYVVEGSVRRVGSRLRITAQLIHAATGYQLWSGSFDANASDPFKVQAEISEKISAEIEQILGGFAPRTTGHDAA